MNHHKETKSFYIVGLNYKKADVSTRSKFSLSKNQQIQLLKDARSNHKIKGLIVLSTCNRIELMGFVSSSYELISILCKYSMGSTEEFSNVAYVFKNREAARHVITMATGVDSQIIGDYEIVSQLKDAFTQAKQANTINAYLERLINVALQCSKAVKNETSLSSGATTVSYSSILYIKENFSDLTNKNILVYGLGDIGIKTVKCCVDYLPECNVTVINRTDSKSFELANDLDINVEIHTNLRTAIKKADFIIVATGAENPTITPELLDDNRSYDFFDLSVPRNIDPQISKINGNTIIDVDELSIITNETIETRKQQIPEANRIIDKYALEFFDWLYFRKHTPAINSLKASLDTMKDDIIDQYFKKHNDIDYNHLESVTSQMVNKIVSKFAMHLKQETTQIPESVKTINQIFKVDAVESKSR